MHLFSNLKKSPWLKTPFWGSVIGLLSIGAIYLKSNQKGCSVFETLEQGILSFLPYLLIILGLLSSIAALIRGDEKNETCLWIGIGAAAVLIGLALFFPGILSFHF